MTDSGSFKRSAVKTLVFAGAAALPLALGLSAPASADSTSHFYIEIGGTGAAEPAPTCTHSYGYANQHLNGGIAVPVCYPASFGPLQGSNGSIPGVGAPTFDDSVHQGYVNLLNAVENTYHANPDALFTITGYSQGAQAADDVLQTIANGSTDIPKSQVNGMLYADPQQPGAGIWSVVPKGLGIGIATSPGPGPAEFNGIPVERYCIQTDGICDATSLESIVGFDVQHPLYPNQDGIIQNTLATQNGEDGITCYAPGGTTVISSSSC